MISCTKTTGTRSTTWNDLLLGLLLGLGEKGGFIVGSGGCTQQHEMRDSVEAIHAAGGFFDIQWYVKSFCVPGMNFHHDTWAP